MRKHKDFMSEPDYGYIDIESCFEPIFEPPLETLEEWHSWEDEPEPTLENTSVYVTEPDGIQYFYCGNTRIRGSEHFSQAGKPMDQLSENVVQSPARHAGKSHNKMSLNHIHAYGIIKAEVYCKRGLFRLEGGFLL